MHRGLRVTAPETAAARARSLEADAPPEHIPLTVSYPMVTCKVAFGRE